MQDRPIAHKPPSKETPHGAPSSGVIVIIDGERMTLTREQEALIRSWAAGPV